jgi:hypothetical protein
MASCDHDPRVDFFLTVRLKAWRTSLFRIGILCFLLALAPNCATQRIIGNEFVHQNKGYSFALPGGDWTIDQEAWRDERDFGYIFVTKRPKSRFVRNPRSLRGAKRGDLDIRTLPEKKVEKLLLNMDVGFRNKTHAGKILVGTILEGSLIKFLKGNFIKTDSDLPENLIAGYMERLRDFYPPQNVDPVVVTVRNLAQSGQAYRMEWVEEREFRVLVGISIYKEFLFISLKMNEKAPAANIEEALKTLDRLVESVVILAVE